MKITIKTLQQHTFIVEIDPTETVADLKKKIENAKGQDIFPVAGQKLIYAGKMLDDAKTLQEYEIDENNFVVVMVSKIKSTSPPQQSFIASAESEPSNKQEDCEPQRRSPSFGAATSGSSSDQLQAMPSESSDVTASALPTGAQYEENLENIVAMGFAADDVKLALRASFNNPDRAVEYLTTGIPDSLQHSRVIEGQPSAESGTGHETTAEDYASDKNDENPFEFLRKQPQFQLMCRTLRENPSYLPSFMQELRESNPELLSEISRNQPAFIDLINSTTDVVEQSVGRSTTSSREAVGGHPPTGTRFIQISAEDKAAVERLKNLGFSEADAIQVYMACDKNETLAANILLEDPDSD